MYLFANNLTQAVASTAEDFDPPSWSCGFGREQEINAIEENVRRSLYHDDNQNHPHHFNPSNTEETMADLHHSIRGSQFWIGKNRRVQANYFHWVDIYVEIDRELCVDNGEGAICDAGTIGPNTINYVNALFVGANTGQHKGRNLN